MKKTKLFLTMALSSLFLTSCASYNEMVPNWAEICSGPVDTVSYTHLTLPTTIEV